ncbi:MAG: FAD:protein FMN transferase [Actinobacteria bacterium]|nr:FAD:protein FMN transferase [Actinomycetota bacterium]
MTPTVQRARFRAMGSAVDVEITGGSPGHLTLARDRLAFLESCWSRFQPYSDVSRLNDAQGESIPVNPATIVLLESMEVGYAATDGAFDPTLLEPLVSWGYSNSWIDPSARTRLPDGVQSRGFIRGLSVDVNGNTAQLPPGTAVDAGGIGKGLAADMVAEMLIDDGVRGAKVSVGGDVRVIGEGPDDGGWTVPVDDAFDPTVTATEVMLAEGGLATIGRLRKAWITRDGQQAHELLDPTTRAPLPTGFESPAHATVLAHSAVWAEVHATLVMVRGAVNTFHRLAGDGLGARVVDGGGQTFFNTAWATFGR